MTIEKLVPPLGLCKLIPDGEFADTYAAYFSDANGANITLDKREGDSVWKDVVIAPAPTLQEIMEDLPHDDAYNDLLIGYSAKVEKLTGWHIYYSGDRKRHTYDQSAVTAALKLWLKQKGIKHD